VEKDPIRFFADTPDGVKKVKKRINWMQPDQFFFFFFFVEQKMFQLFSCLISGRSVCVSN